MDLKEEVLAAARELFLRGERPTYVWATWEDVSRAYDLAGGEEWGDFGQFCESLGIDMFIPADAVGIVDTKRGTKWVSK